MNRPTIIEVRKLSVRVVALVALIVLPLLDGRSPAAAQQGPTSTTRSTLDATTSSSTSTVLEPTSSTSGVGTSSSSVPEPSTSTVTSPPTSLLVTGPIDDPAGAEDAPAEPVPVNDVTVPKSGVVINSKTATQALAKNLTAAEVNSTEADEQFSAATVSVDELSRALADVEAELAKLDDQNVHALDELDRLREQVKAQVINSITYGDSFGVMALLTSKSPSEAARRAGMQSALVNQRRDVFSAYVKMRDSIPEQVLAAKDIADELRFALDQARRDLVAAQAAKSQSSLELAIYAAGGEILISGFVFPVGQPHNFVDSFGYPRMAGTEYSHSHQGTDIMAPFGTPLYAAERGVITKMGSDVLGGTKLWLKGQSDTYYYYAHLQSYAPGIAEGTLVEAGTVVGFVGDTGNARGGAPHLHFEVHPGGGAAVNPYPLLDVADTAGNR